METIKSIKSRTTTTYKTNVLDNIYAQELYKKIRDTIEWNDGIYSRKNGFTRLAHGIDPVDLLDQNNTKEYQEIYKEIFNVILEAIVCFNLSTKPLCIGDIYLNYYRNGNDYTPNHSHPKSKQLVISLGAKRKLEIGRKSIEMENGSAILFGSSVHGVPKDLNVTEGRISIAVFLIYD